MEKEIERLDKDTLIRIARQLSAHADPCVAGEEIIFQIAGIRPKSQEPPNIDLTVVTTETHTKQDVKYAMKTVQRIIPEYEEIKVDNDFDEQGNTRIRLTR